jgi:Ni/Co efflux regulator RcnB
MRALCLLASATLAMSTMTTVASAQPMDQESMIHRAADRHDMDRDKDKDRDRDRGCHWAKDHYGRSHKFCGEKYEPRCHWAKDHYGRSHKYCDKD